MSKCFVCTQRWSANAISFDCIDVITRNAYLYIETLVRPHTVYYIRAIYRLAANTGIAPQPFGTLTNMAVSVCDGCHQIFVSICFGRALFVVHCRIIYCCVRTVHLGMGGKMGFAARTFTY